MSVLYFNNCWFTNVGEAFIDIGGMELVRKIFPGEKIINISAMNAWYIDSISSENAQMLDMSDYYWADYVVYPGMYATEEFCKSKAYQMMLKLKAKGVKIIFLGLGQIAYTEREKQAFIEVIKKVEPALIVSRDDCVYNNFKDYAPTVKGIDCAFWVKDVYDPRCTITQKYDVITFNRSPEPIHYSEQCVNKVVRAFRFQYYLNKQKVKDNMLISDTPYDYLTLYGNAEAVYTDLVHASIPALQYGVPVKFERVDKRGYAVDAIEGLEQDAQGFIFVKEEDLELQKKRVEDEIYECLHKG